MNKLYAVVLFLLAADYVSATFTHTYTYEFGQNEGAVLTKLDGTIPPLKPVTKIDLDISSDSTVEYVKVVVNAISPPKVDYDSDKRQVTIMYSWTQISLSTYSILAKGYLYD